jgi:hypothetical protein
MDLMKRATAFISQNEITPRALARFAVGELLIANKEANKTSMQQENQTK